MTATSTSTATSTNATAVTVQVSGPEWFAPCDQFDRPVFGYVVWTEADNGNPTGRVYEFLDQHHAQRIARQIARDRHLELVDQSQPMTDRQRWR